ncbi:MAG TPA: L-serine ammonia-lyase, iron-sulfur-dependent, subunit alpha [Firmicutes bacterium]|nr:L-serine ammonia-lyase, iron-sulfur-dependent, subunit alpha [Bacillota bacterium]
MISYRSIQELVQAAVSANTDIGTVVLHQQAAEQGRSTDELYRQMQENLQVMRESVEAGLRNRRRSPSGLSGGDAHKLLEAVQQDRTIGGSLLGKALARAMAVAEVNASMGRIVAAPTAGSCGILPAALLTVMDERNIPEERAILGLFTAGGVGLVISKQATISGAQGGCQAECGSAAAMAAAAIVEMVGGTPQQAAHACAIALKNVLGLVCDPVAGLVEVPCIKRNAAGVANALVAADLALAGVESAIPADEVIEAMRSVGSLMSSALKETAEGGLAATATARRLARQLLNC